MCTFLLSLLYLGALTWAAPTAMDTPTGVSKTVSGSGTILHGVDARTRVNSSANNCWEYWSRQWRTHGESWIMNKVWKFACKNGSASIAACIGSERSKFAEIPVGETLDVGGFWHKCIKDGDTVRYSQEPSCVVDGKELHVNETFSQGKFQMQCSTDGYSIIGCLYTEDGTVKALKVGEDALVGVVKHSCKSDPKLPGRVLYSSFTTACKRNDQIFQEGETWTSNHLKFVCGARGAYSIKACITSDGDEIQVGKNVTISGIMHQCYRIGNTVYYHSFSCAIDDAACREAEITPVAQDEPSKDPEPAKEVPTEPKDSKELEAPKETEDDEKTADKPDKTP